MNNRVGLVHQANREGPVKYRQVNPRGASPGPGEQREDGAPISNEDLEEQRAFHDDVAAIDYEFDNRPLIEQVEGK